jgi:hypothetical protein
VQQTSGNGIFDGKHPDDGAILMHVLEYFLKRVATNQFYFFVGEELMGCYVVKRTWYTLYSYSFHLVV